MTVERKIAKVFKLSDKNWLRHSNPWSVWTRFSVLPILIFSIWSRIWIGWWYLVAITISLLWVFLNPLLFSKPKSTNNWASKSVMGERVFSCRDQIDIPKIHKGPIFKILNTVTAVGLLLAFWATIYYSTWGVLFGIALTYLGKSWYLDRMVWLFEDMKQLHETYKGWEY